jgi:hypothetical protein
VEKEQYKALADRQEEGARLESVASPEEGGRPEEGASKDKDLVGSIEDVGSLVKEVEGGKDKKALGKKDKDKKASGKNDKDKL